MKKILFTFSLLSISLCSIVSAQDFVQYITETETHIFWQADRRLTFADFQMNEIKDSAIQGYVDKFGMRGEASTGLWHVVDIPMKKYKKECPMDVFHVVPAFQKDGSFIIDNDSLGYWHGQLMFDLRELEARLIRRELSHIKAQVEGEKIDNFYSMFAMSAVAYGDDVYHKILNSCINSLYIEKKEGSFEECRFIIDSTLNSLQEFATTPEDCHRFATLKPIDKRYEKAKQIMGPLMDINRKEE